MGSLTIEQRKERFDDAFKVLITVFTVLVSIAVGSFRETSPESAAFLFAIYSFTLFSWSVAHLWGGEFEYFLKFVSWYELLGGIVQAIIMLYIGTLHLNIYYFAANWVAALIIYYFIFRYVRSFLAKELHKDLRTLFFVMIILAVVFSSLKFLSVF